MPQSSMAFLFLHPFLLITFAILAPRISVADIIPTSIFIFGDSTADVGTNTQMKECKFKSNYPPYGMLYPGAVPTGRWSNGLHTIDYICKYMLKHSEGSPKSYMELSEKKDPDFEQGVNFASAGSGLMNTTGVTALINPMKVQMDQFVNIVLQKLKLSRTEEDLKSIWLPKAVFLISVGSNDIIEYNEATSRSTVEKYAQDLVDLYNDFIEELYNHGARKFALIGVLKVGCCPALREVGGNCSSKYSSLSSHFTIGLKSHLIQLQKKYTDLKYAFGDVGFMMDNAMNPKTTSRTFGIFKVFDKACCKSCDDSTKPVESCENPKEYAFWDGYHPTDTASKIVADELYFGTGENDGKKYVTPISFKKLVEGDLADYVDDDYLDNLRQFDAMFKSGN